MSPSGSVGDSEDWNLARGFGAIVTEPCSNDPGGEEVRVQNDGASPKPLQKLASADVPPSGVRARLLQGDGIPARAGESRERLCVDALELDGR